MKTRYYYFGAFVIFMLLAIAFNTKLNEFLKPLKKQQVTEIIKAPCIGIIEEIDDNQATIYYIVNKERFSFSQVGRYEIYVYAQVGDSIIKQSNSKEILIKKSNDSRTFSIE